MANDARMYTCMDHQYIAAADAAAAILTTKTNSRSLSKLHFKVYKSWFHDNSLPRPSMSTVPISSSIGRPFNFSPKRHNTMPENVNTTKWSSMLKITLIDNEFRVDDDEFISSHPQSNKWIIHTMGK